MQSWSHQWIHLGHETAQPAVEKRRKKKALISVHIEGKKNALVKREKKMSSVYLMNNDALE